MVTAMSSTTPTTVAAAPGASTPRDPLSADTAPPTQHDVALTGRLDADAAIELRDWASQTVADGPVLLLVDISEITQVTASGMAGMLEIQRLVRSRGGDVRMYGSSPAVRDAQFTSQLATINRVYPDRARAVSGRPARSLPSSAPRRRRRGLKWAKAQARLEAKLYDDARRGLLFPHFDGTSPGQSRSSLPTPDQSGPNRPGFQGATR